MRIYKIAQEEKRPYNILKLAHGVETSLGIVWAYSSEQARMFAIKNHSRLGDYLEMGYEIIARLDKKKWEEIKGIKEIEEEIKEEQIQNAWWQK